MASDISNAVTSANYYSPKQASIKETKLIDVTGGAAGDASGGMALARSLGVLGDAALAETESFDKRGKAIDAAVVEKVISRQTDEDMRKLAGVDMLQTYTDFDRSDSPYARVLVEKMRGQYLSAQSKSAYGELIASEGYAKTADEETARYNKFTADNFAKMSEVTSDPEAFKTGFYESHLTDQLSINTEYRKNKAKEMLTVAKGNVQLELNSLAENGMNMSPDEFKEKMQTIFSSSTLAGVPLEDRIAMAAQFAETHFGNNGRPGMIDGLSDAVIGTTRTGQPITFGMSLNTENLRKKAEVRDSYLHEGTYRKTVETLGGSKTTAQAWASYDALAPSMKREVAGAMDGIISAIEKRNKAELVKTNKAFVSKNTLEAKSSILKDQYVRSLAGDKIDSNRNPVAHSLGSLPKFTDYSVDAEGNFTPKAGTFTREDVAAFADNEIQYIMGSDISPDDKASKVLDLLSVGFMSDYSQTYKMQIDKALSRISPSNVSNGQVEMNDGTQQALNMYKQDPVRFRNLFGKDTSAIVDTIVDLETTEGSTQGAITAYGQVREKLDNPVIRNDFEKDVTNALTSAGSFKYFKGLNGDNHTVDVNASANATLSSQLQTQAVYEMANGYTKEEAVQRAAEKVRQSNFIYKDTAIPKSLTLAGSPQATLFVLDDIKNAANDLGVADAALSFEWNADRQLLAVRGGSYYKTFTKEELMGRISAQHKKMEDSSTAAANTGLTLKDVEAGRQPTDNGVEDILNTTSGD